MKKSKGIWKIAIWMVAVFVTGINALQAYAGDMEGSLVIIIRQKPPTPGNAPRTIEDIPFYGELTNLGVLLVADTDWGEATVTLSSLEGDYYQTVFDMADVSILLPVNGNAGDSYTLTIVVENGLAFEGEFIL